MRRALTFHIDGKMYYTTRISTALDMSLNVVKWPGITFQKLESAAKPADAVETPLPEPAANGGRLSDMDSSEMRDLNRVQWPGRSDPSRGAPPGSVTAAPPEPPAPVSPASEKPPALPRPEPPPAPRADNAHHNTWKALTSASAPIAMDTDQPAPPPPSLPSKKTEREWIEARRNPRKSCSIPVDYACHHRVCSGMVLNLSLCGAYIRTDSPLNPGEELYVTIPFSESKKPVKLKSLVVRNDGRGMGVEFKRRVL